MPWLLEELKGVHASRIVSPLEFEHGSAVFACGPRWP
jgi:hypothetical protein